MSGTDFQSRSKDLLPLKLGFVCDCTDGCRVLFAADQSRCDQFRESHHHVQRHRNRSVQCQCRRQHCGPASAAVCGRASASEQRAGTERAYESDGRWAHVVIARSRLTRRLERLVLLHVLCKCERSKCSSPSVLASVLPLIERCVCRPVWTVTLDRSRSLASDLPAPARRTRLVPAPLLHRAPSPRLWLWAAPRISRFRRSSQRSNRPVRLSHSPRPSNRWEPRLSHRSNRSVRRVLPSLSPAALAVRERLSLKCESCHFT